MLCTIYYIHYKLCTSYHVVYYTMYCILYTGKIHTMGTKGPSHKDHSPMRVNPADLARYAFW